MIKCPVCGYYTISKKWDICPVCYWEYEGEEGGERKPGSANGGLTINEAKTNFSLYRACDQKFSKNVRPPYNNEIPEDMARDGSEKVFWEIYLHPYYRSIIEQDRNAVVICNLKDEIVYMNPAARKIYQKHGDLVGTSIMDCHNERSCEIIAKVREWFAQSPSHNIIYTFHNEKQNKDVYMVALRDGDRLIGYYEKHEFRNPETMPQYAFDE